MPANASHVPVSGVEVQAGENPTYLNSMKPWGKLHCRRSTPHDSTTFFCSALKVTSAFAPACTDEESFFNASSVLLIVTC